jgi:glutamyl/glutaminyl-tRNA synthetase
MMESAEIFQILKLMSTRLQARKPVVRMRMPQGETVFTDAIRGEVKFEHLYVPDFVLVRAMAHHFIHWLLQ